MRRLPRQATVVMLGVGSSGRVLGWGFSLALSGAVIIDIGGWVPVRLAHRSWPHDDGRRWRDSAPEAMSACVWTASDGVASA